MSGAIFRVTLACLLALSCAQGGGSAFTDDDGELSQGGSDNLPCGIDCSGIVGAQCQVGVCDEATLQCKLVPAADGGECDDGLFCTLDDACVAGECTGGRANECDLAATGCTENTCNESTKTCTNTTLPNGASCVSSDLCVIGGTCTNGQCIGTLNDCFFAPVPNQCHVAVCNPSTGTCDPIPGNFGTACTDFDDLCTVGKTCDTQGTCQGGAPKDCSSLSVGCNNGLCNTTNGQCYPDPIPDGMTCAQATDDCNQGYCSAGVCNPTPINETLGCDDGLACTANTTCTTGVCGGGQSTIDIFLFDDFANTLGGWTLGNEWGIGPTALSTGNSGGCPNPDPALDHTSTSDNGVAGVVLGGNAGTSLHDFYWITSAVMDTSAAPQLFLQFYRHLNSDYTPYMENRIEVFNGTSWQIVFQTGPSPGIVDSAWTLQTYDISAHKNANMQVRFGFNIGSSGVYTCSGWNIDDVMIATGPC